MARIDFITGPWKAIWAGLEAHPEWASAIPVNNRLKYVPGEATVVKKKLTDDSSFPKAFLVPTDIVDDLYTGTEVFATQDEDFNPNSGEWYESIYVVYLLEINSKTLKLGQIDLIGVYTLEAIRRLGPKLNLPYVKSVGKISIIQKESDRKDTTHRWDFFVKIPVMMQFEGRDLL